MFDAYFWAEWRRTPGAYDEAPPLGAWLVVGGLAGLGAWVIVREHALLGALWHPAVVLAVLGAVALVTGWVRDGAWRLCLLVGLDVFAALGASLHVAAWANGWAIPEHVAWWLAVAVALHILPGVWLHLRAWTMVASDWGLHVWSATHAAEVRAALSAPRGRDGVFVATSVQDGDAVGALRDGAGEQPVVLRAELLSSRFAKVPMEVPAAYLVTGMEVAEERVPSHGYREQQTRRRVVSFGSSRFLGSDPERAAEGTSYLGDVARAVLLVVVQHVVVLVLSVVVAMALAGLIDAWT